MKRFSISPTSVFTFLLLPVLFLFIKRKRKFGLLYLLVISFLFMGCYKNFYKTNTKTNIDNSTLSALKNPNKYFIFHLKEGNYALKNLSVNNNLVEADVEPISPEHEGYVNPKSSATYKKADENNIFSEIHMYATNQSLENKNHLSIPISSITRVDMYEKDTQRTRSNHTVSTIGAVVGGAAIILLVAVAISCNCPQVYTYDGSQYQFKSGVFSGAIYSSLEKTDYLPLENLKDVNGKYMFRLMNNQQEEQYINQLQLINIPHDASTNVLLDRHGVVHTYKQPASPVSTSLKNDKGEQLLKLRDGNSFMFNEKAEATSDFGSVILTFEKPANTKEATLIVNAKNSLWSGYLFEEFSSLFGNKFQKYQAKQDKTDGREIERWQKEQALSLLAYVQTEKGWQLIDYFSTTGNTAGRDMIMAVNIPDTKQNKIRIKLESAFMFWDVDYAAMDFSSDVNLKPEFINVSTAVKSNNSGNEAASLHSKDNQYVKLLKDEFLSAEFNNSTTTKLQNSYFLVSTGYYHSIKQYTGKADLIQLNHFKKKGSFTEFSEKKFTETQKMLAKGIDLQTHSKN